MFVRHSCTYLWVISSQVAYDEEDDWTRSLIANYISQGDRPLNIYTKQGITVRVHLYNQVNDSLVHGLVIFGYLI